MNLDYYQKRIKEFDMYPDAVKPTIYLLGAYGELGELTNNYKKIFRDHGSVIPNKQLDFALEMGDVIWYITRFSNHMGWTLEEIIQLNLEKLESRFKRGKVKGGGDNR